MWGDRDHHACYPARVAGRACTQAAAPGMAIDSYAAGLLEEAVDLLVARPLEVERSPREAAIERLKTFGQTHGLSFGGVRLREFRHDRATVNGIVLDASLTLSWCFPETTAFFDALVAF